MSSSNKPKSSWRQKESRYCCTICNVWMGNDRQSILMHENGRKHKENVEKTLQDKRKKQLDDEKNKNFLLKSIAQMTSDAISKTQTIDAPSAAFSAVPLVPGSSSILPSSSSYMQRHVPQQQLQHQNNGQSGASNASIKKEKEEWNAMRREKKRDKSNDDDQDEEEEARKKKKKTKQIIAPDEGHYSRQLDNNEESKKITYLEAVTFYGILEEEMPIQIWTGPLLSSLEEKRLPERDIYWKSGLIVNVRKNANNDAETTCNVAYLKSPEDQEETLEKKVPLDRIRIILGSDECIPNTLEEARLLAIGGEEIQVVQQTDPQADKTATTNEASDPEAATITSWSTVSIKRTTIHQQLKEERQTIRERKKLAAIEQEKKQKEIDRRKMEEAKVDNADDSALGAYDVFSSGKHGYKGVDINNNVKLSVYDTSKKLVSNNANAATATAFKKKSSFKTKNKKKQNRRTTSADDGD